MEVTRWLLRRAEVSGVCEMDEKACARTESNEEQEKRREKGPLIDQTTEEGERRSANGSATKLSSSETYKSE
jgi:hypothetical protein